ncbi:hypothetical protein ABC977_02830 [Thioalkalicoccus limnaeus]|uniref:RES domain-containing protein n=1 Tax=Thioalkalicoccus limnaeus TaxID=120681 RepID=A0ABV4BDL4_9GAMM
MSNAGRGRDPGRPDANQLVSRHHDPFGVLYPAATDAMAVALDQVQIPGPPVGFDLTPAESRDPDPAVRYRRRTIQRLTGRDWAGDRMALIDKATPHALYDLMLSEVSVDEKPSPRDVALATNQSLWRIGSNFIAFVSDPAVRRDFGLAGGVPHLAMNCDPNTRDRESVQAAKQFHLHLICWTRDELAGLARPDRFAEVAQVTTRRQVLDPLAFVAARLLPPMLGDRPLQPLGGRWLAPDDRACLDGTRPFGASIRLPGWSVLAQPAFGVMIQVIHDRLITLATLLLEAFTGKLMSPDPWRRHRLLAAERIRANLRELALPVEACTALEVFAARLRDLPEAVVRRLARGGSVRRQHLMTLNLPSYALCLHGAGGAAATPDSAVDLSIQPRLFSGIGGAGLVGLAGVPCVRIARGRGRYSFAQWAERARFQRDFATFNQRQMADLDGLVFEPVRTFAGVPAGWLAAERDADRDRGAAPR